MKTLIFFLFVFLCTPVVSEGYDVFGFGYYDIKLDGSSSKDAWDYRYERRFNHSLFKIGPESYKFFDLKKLFNSYPVIIFNPLLNAFLRIVLLIEFLLFSPLLLLIFERTERVALIKIKILNKKSAPNVFWGPFFATL